MKQTPVQISLSLGWRIKRPTMSPFIHAELSWRLVSESYFEPGTYHRNCCIGWRAQNKKWVGLKRANLSPKVRVNQSPHVPTVANVVAASGHLQKSVSCRAASAKAVAPIRSRHGAICLFFPIQLELRKGTFKSPFS